jgi:hypothetical protein
LKAVYKYALRGDGNTLELPVDACALSVGFQGEMLYMWVIVDTSEPMETRSFWVAGTGHVLPAKDLIYIGTAQKETGSFASPDLVLHVFEVDG